MSFGHNLVMCNLCTREFPKYIGKENKIANPDLKKLFGLEADRNKNYNIVLTFHPANQTSINKHICVSCIFDIVNKFGNQ